MRFIVSCLFVMFFMTAGGLALAQETAPSKPQDRIVAKINEDIITSGDVWERFWMVQKTAGLPDSAQIRADAFPQILNSLIDETIQWQEARRLKIEVTKEDLQTAVDDLAKKNNLSSAEFEKNLLSTGVNVEEVRRQLKAQLAWIQVIKRVVRPTVAVSDAEVEKLRQSIDANKGKRVYKMAEIRLPARTPAQKADSVKLARNLIQQMSKGVKFREVAAKFSEVPSAKEGGLRASVLEGQNELPPVIEKLMGEMPVGALSNPIEADQQIWLVLKIDQRVREGAPEREALLERIGTRKLEEAAATYLRELRGEALIEYPQ